jgi:hypothetical protein
MGTRRDPRRIDLVRTPHIEAQRHLKLMPGTNVAPINSLAHVVVTEVSAILQGPWGGHR